MQYICVQISLSVFKIIVDFITNDSNNNNNNKIDVAAPMMTTLLGNTRVSSPNQSKNVASTTLSNVSGNVTEIK